MKKIYTLLAALCVCISAMALPTLPMMSGKNNLQLTEKGKKILAQGPESLTIVDQQTRSFTDGNNRVWNLNISLSDYGYWELFKFESPVTPADLPWRLAYLSVGTQDDSQYWEYWLMWPTKFFLGEWGFCKHDEKGNIIVPEDVEVNVDPIMIDDLFEGYYCEWIEDNWPPVFATPNDDEVNIYFFNATSDEAGKIDEILGSIMYTPNYFGGNDKPTIDGTKVEYYSGSKGQSQFEVRKFDISNNYLEAVTSCYYTQNAAAAPRSSTIFYKGECKHRGFYPTFTRGNVTDLHIFNGGQVGNKFLREIMRYQVVPQDIALTRFYMEAFMGKCEYAYRLSTEDNFAFDSEQIGWHVESEDDIAGSGVIFGALYSAPTDAAEPEIPTEKWEMLEFPAFIQIEEGEFEVNPICPAVQSMLPSAYDFAPIFPIEDKRISPHDGTAWFDFTEDGGATVNFFLEPTTFQIGTTVGAEFYSLRGVDTHYFTYDGKIIYHYDPTDVRKTKEVDAVGTTPAGVKTVADNSFNVTVNGNSIQAEGAQVYNLNGQLVNANDLAKGIYVVRSGNKAVKVLVK